MFIVISRHYSWCFARGYVSLAPDLSRLRSPAHLLLPRRCPELALLLQVFALLQLSLPEVAAQQGVAVLIHPVGEVLAGDADATALPSLQLPLVNERPLLHADLS